MYLKPVPSKLSLSERLALIGLIEEGLKGRSMVREQNVSQLFENLSELINKTISGARINMVKNDHSKAPFHTIQIQSEMGEQLGRLHTLYLKKPYSCYYLVYVEVEAPYRKKGLGTKILKYFNNFLESKQAIGILDNVIPEDDPAYDIYKNNNWVSIDELVKKEHIPKGTKYMFYLPQTVIVPDLSANILKLVYHIHRKKELIHMRENEVMVQKTIEEFKELYKALELYFEQELKRNIHTPLMRYLFTKFTTKFISFRRRISELIGYTGGESLEQIRFSDQVKNIPIQSYAPRGMTEKADIIYGDMKVWNSLPLGVRRQPARYIESLPNYRRPSYISWIIKRGLGADPTLTIGDLLDIGFDPTRLKEFGEQGQRCIFERMQIRQVEEVLKKTRLLLELGQRLSRLDQSEVKIQVNPSFFILTDGGNAYVLRRKVEAIHWDEALEQILTNPCFKRMDQAFDLELLLKRTVKKVHSTVESVMEREIPIEFFTYFVSWNLRTNQPILYLDFHRTSWHSVYLA